MNNETDLCSRPSVCVFFFGAGMCVFLEVGVKMRCSNERLKLTMCLKVLEYGNMFVLGEVRWAWAQYLCLEE